jgi:hypothetical protein
MSYYRQATVGIITLLWILISVGLLVYAISQKPADLQFCTPTLTLNYNCTQPPRRYYQLQDLTITAAVACNEQCQCPNVTLNHRYWCARWTDATTGLQLLLEGPKEERVAFYALGALLLMAILGCIVLPEVIERWANPTVPLVSTTDQHLTLVKVQRYGGPTW